MTNVHPALNQALYEYGELYISERQIFLALIDDGWPASVAEAYAQELSEYYSIEADAMCAGEIEAENAWLRHAENAGYDTDGIWR